MFRYRTAVHHRSWLYVPGDSDHKLGRSLDCGADAIIADLEDGIAPAARPSARAGIAGWLAGDRLQAPGAPAAWVRLSAEVEADLEAVLSPALQGVVVPKVDGADALARVDGVLSELESSLGLELGAVAVSPRIESARGLRAIDAIATAPRVLLLGLGEADLVADLGLDPGGDGLELLPARFAAVAASAAAGLQPPVGPASTAFRDLEALEASTTSLRRLGFAGRTAIHPDQVPVINAVFTPSPAQVAAAEQVLADLERGGGGAAAVDDRSMVDEAVARSARRVLARARRARDQ